MIAAEFMALALVCWVTTLLLVESELTRPLREWLTKRRDAYEGSYCGRWRYLLYAKARYFVGCHLCTGTWVGLLLAWLVPYRLPGTSGFIGWVVAGLLIKAGAHFALILQHRLADHGVT